LKATAFKPLPLEYQSWFQNVPFKWVNVRRYTQAQVDELISQNERLRGSIAVGRCTLCILLTHLILV
jgi:hypothetical protein